MQKLINKRSIVIDYLMMIVGTGLLAAAIQCLYDPIGLVTGGFTGLAIVIKAVTERFVPGGIPLWLTNIGLNVPLFFLTLKFKGKRFIWRTVVGTVLLSAWIYVIPAIDLTQQDYFLAAIFWWCDRWSRYGTDPISAFYYGWNGTSGSIDPAFYQTLFRGSDHAGIRCDDRAYRFISVRYQGSHVCNCCHFCHNESVGWSDGRI